MLQFTRTQAAATLVTVLVLCGLAVPNLVSDETIAGWPQWAQRRIMLAPEVQGGTSVLLEVDRNDVLESMLKTLFDDVRGVLRDAHLGLASPAAIRSGGVEVKPLAGDFETALAKLAELSRAFNGVSPVEVTDSGDGLIRLTPTDAGVREYEPRTVEGRIRDIRARLSIFNVPATVEPEGAWRIRVRSPAFVLR